MECDYAALLDRGWFISQTLGAFGAQLRFTELDAAGVQCRPGHRKSLQASVLQLILHLTTALCSPLLVH